MSWYQSLALPTPLMEDGWIDWSETVSGLRSRRRSYGQTGAPTLNIVEYTDRRGRVRTPPLHPHTGMTFLSTPTSREAKLSSQWLQMIDLWAADLATSGINGAVLLPGGAIDARGFQWHGLAAEMRYTYVADFTLSLPEPDSAIRKRINKATRGGYRGEMCDDPDVIFSCLVDTEARQKFSHGVDARTLRELWNAMPKSAVRGHCVRASSGEVVSAGVRLVAPGGWAIDWLQGTKRAHLDQGVNQLAYDYALQDLQSAGAKLFDFGGGNIRNVARAKEKWGFPLTPYICLTQPSLRDWGKDGFRLGKAFMQCLRPVTP